MSVTAEDIEKFTARQTAGNLIRSLELLDRSVPRAKGEPSRIESLRAAVSKALGGGGDHDDFGGADDDDGELTREPARSKAASTTRFQFQRGGERGGTIIIEGADAALKALSGKLLYVHDDERGYLAVAEVE